MKTFYKILKINSINLFIICLMLLASCSSTQYSSNNDDVYYSRKNKQISNTVPVTENSIAKTDNEEIVTVQPTEQSVESVGDNSKFDQTSDQRYSSNNQSIQNNDSTQKNPSYSNSETYTDENGNAYVTNNYYNDDYYDYEYSSRLRRFHQPNLRYNYYDDYYTNSYWYSYDPYSYGTSIYLGYNWYWPHYSYFRPGWDWSYGIGFGWGMPLGYCGWDPFYSSYYPYWYGYGYHNSYWHNNYDYAYYYYNSHDKGGSNNYHHGGRGPISSYANKTSAKNYSSAENSMSFGDKYKSIVANKSNINIKPSSNIINNGNKIIDQQISPATKINNMDKKSNIIMNNKIENKSSNILAPVESSPVQKNTSMQNNIISKPNINTNNSDLIQKTIVPTEKSAKETYTKPVQKINNPGSIERYNKPSMNNFSKPVQKYSKPKTYISPGYSQPKSGQYYARPNINSVPGQIKNENREQNQIVNPGNNQKNEYNAPKIDRGNQNRINNSSSPSIQPQQNYSSPSRSNNSINNSGGARSNESHSAPSNSGSGGGRRR